MAIPIHKIKEIAFKVKANGDKIEGVTNRQGTPNNGIVVPEAPGYVGPNIIAGTGDGTPINENEYPPTY